jgi:ADP-L-glycero-D-manno-heptose 6-epimerase
MSRRVILVTGGAGFIGSNIAAALGAAFPLDVAVCDQFSSHPNKWRNLSACPIFDVIGQKELFPWLDRNATRLEMIVHMGAISSTTGTDVDRLVQVNFGLSRDLFVWAADNKIRFIYASSAATYGNGAQGFDDRNDEEWLAGLRPLQPYGWSKALFDLYAARQAARSHAPRQWVGLKFFNVYGPNEEHKGLMMSVAGQMSEQIQAGGPARLFRSLRPNYPDGGQLRDFVYVKDVCSVVCWLVENERISGIYNFGTGTPRSFNDVAQALFKAIGKPTAIEYFDPPPELHARYQYYTAARMQRLRALGYDQPATPLETGVRDYVRYLFGSAVGGE